MIDVALATLLNATSISSPLRPLRRITIVATANSETPLPEEFQLRNILNSPTQSVAAQRSIRGELDAVVQHLSVASVVPLSEEAQATVDEILAKNAPVAGSKRRLLPRNK
jgi:hypothetical protein